MPKNEDIPKFVLERSKPLTQEQVERVLAIKPEEVNKSLLIELFSRKGVKNEDGTWKVSEPYLYTSQEFTLPAKTLPNQPNEVRTTVGLYIFNLHILADVFVDTIPYINYSIDEGAKGSLMNMISSLLMTKKITTRQFKEFQDRINRIASSCSFLMDGLGKEAIIRHPAIEKAKKELYEKYKDLIEKGDLIGFNEKVENKLIEIAREELKQYPAYIMFSKGGKPSFTNNYKNSMITAGAQLDPMTNEYVIAKNSYNDGVDLDHFNVSVNKAIIASYMRGVKTQDGGAMTKFIYALMHNVTAGPDKSDCGSEMYREIVLTKERRQAYLYRFIYEGKKDSNGKRIYTELTEDVIDKYIGKKIKLRTPLFCRSKSNSICNVCLGTLFNRLDNIKNIGLTTTRASASIMYVAMKAMHNMTVKIQDVDIYNYIHKLD